MGRLSYQIPSGRIQAGESLSATLSYSAFPRSAGWTLAVKFSCAGGAAATVACGSGPNPDDFALSLSATTTTGWMGGRYAFSVWATLANPATVTVAEHGVFNVLANPATPTPAMTILTALNAVILGAASDDQLTVSVDGIQLRYWIKDRGIDELLKLQQRFRQTVETEIGQMGGKGPAYAINHHACEDTRLASPWQGLWPYGGHN